MSTEEEETMKRLLGLFAVALMLVSMIPVSAAAQKKFSGVTLNMASIKWDFMETLMGKYAQDVAKDMGINLRVSWYTYDEHRNKIVADTLAGVPTWDLIYIDTKELPEFAKIGVLDPLDPLFAKYGDKEYDLNDFAKGPLENCKIDEKLYAIPIMADTNGLVYRTDLFKDPGENAAFKARYGYELKVPQTYKEFHDIAEFFTRKKGEKLAGKVLDTDFYGTSHSNKPGDFLWHDYLNYMMAFGGNIYDPRTMMPEWNSSENIAAGKFYVSLGPLMPPGHLNFTSGESMAEFDKGRVAMIIEFYSRTLYLGGKNSAISGKFAFALLPSDKPDRPHATVESINSMGIYAKSRNKEAAFEFLERITSKAVAMKWALHEPDTFFRAGNPLLPRVSVMTNPQVLKRFPALSLLEQTLSRRGVYAFNHIRLVEYPQIIDIGAQSVTDAFAGKPVVTAFNEAQAKLVALFKRAGYLK
jgi:multiple sugar transport system substrate-binding protein